MKDNTLIVAIVCLTLIALMAIWKGADPSDVLGGITGLVGALAGGKLALTNPKGEAK